jgi:hypothetical protein
MALGRQAGERTLIVFGSKPDALMASPQAAPS